MSQEKSFMPDISGYIQERVKATLPFCSVGFSSSSSAFLSQQIMVISMYRS